MRSFEITWFTYVYIVLYTDNLHTARSVSSNYTDSLYWKSTWKHGIMLRVLNFEFMTHNHPFTPGIGQSQVLSLSPSRIPPATQPTSLMAL